MKKREAVTPPDVFTTLLDAARGSELVLVGGQALAVWLRHYGLLAELPEGMVAISNDVDFLTKSAADRWAVSRFAQALHGKSLYPNKRALTALVGQAVLDISEEEYLNVDVIFRLVGMKAAGVQERSVKLGEIRVMHPLDVLYSRLANLYELPEKQTQKGVHQLRLAIDVAREFIRRDVAEHAEASARSWALPYIKLITRWAREDAGRKVAERFGVHVADAIDPRLVPRSSRFWMRFWPLLRGLMSDPYRHSCEPGQAGPPTDHSQRTS